MGRDEVRQRVSRLRDEGSREAIRARARRVALAAAVGLVLAVMVGLVLGGRVLTELVPPQLDGAAVGVAPVGHGGALPTEGPSSRPSTSESPSPSPTAGTCRGQSPGPGCRCVERSSGQFRWFCDLPADDEGETEATDEPSPSL